MKKMIPIVASLFLAFSATAQDHKQPPPPKPPTVEERLQRFSERVDNQVTLSKDQKQKVLAVYKDFFSKTEELRAKYPPPAPPPPPPAPPVAMKEEMDKLIAQKDKSLKSLLSDDQMKKLKEMDQRQGRHGEMPPPPPPVPEK